MKRIFELQQMFACQAEVCCVCSCLFKSVAGMLEEGELEIVAFVSTGSIVFSR